MAPMAYVMVQIRALPINCCLLVFYIGLLSFHDRISGRPAGITSRKWYIAFMRTSPFSVKSADSSYGNCTGLGIDSQTRWPGPRENYSTCQSKSEEMNLLRRNRPSN